LEENQSAQIRGIPNDLNAEELFSAGSIRKFMWSYVPVKARPWLLAAKRSGADAALNELRRVVKHFWKWYRAVQSGRVPMPPIAQFQGEISGADFSIELIPAWSPVSGFVQVRADRKSADARMLN
jgi:hypothetical protein